MDLEEGIAELMELSSKLLREEDAFLILNLYSMGFSSVIAENLAKDYFPDSKEMQFGELIIPERSGKRLPLSVYVRIRR